MPTTLTNGIQLPDKGSVDWYSSMQSNYNLIDTHLGDTDVHVTAEDKANWDNKQGSLSQDQLDAIAQVATNTDDIATLQSDKADASHTHSSSDITDIGDYATKDYVDNSISGLVDNAPDALNTLNELSAALNDDSNFASTVTTALATKADSSDLATVATSGSYTDLTDKPTINDSTITIQKNGSTVDTFTTNGSAKTINIPVPTKTSDLTNDSDFVVSSSLAAVATSGFYNDLDNLPTIPSKISDLIDDSNFVDTSNPAVSSGITSAKVTDYDTHIADTDIHVTTSDKTTWNTVTSKAQDSDVVHKSGDETIGGRKTFSESITCFSNSDAKSIICKTPLSTYDSTNTVGDNTKIRFLDKNNNSISYIMQRKLTNGSTDISLNVSNTDSNNQPIEATLTFILDSANEPRLSPGIDNTISLGRPTFRYKSFYGMNYYYGSNNIEFSQKFVTTDTNQTISGNKTFGDDITLQGTTTPVIKTISNIVQDTSAYNGSVSWVIRDKDNLNNILESSLYKYSGKGIDWQLKLTGIHNGVSNTKGIRFALDPVNNVASFIPIGNNNTSLGNSSTKWKDVNTYLVNGVEPSSLSLPSGNVSDVIDISSYFSNTGSGDINTYTAIANGWIYLRLGDISGCQATILNANNDRMWGQSLMGSVEQLTIPILKGQTLSTQWNTSSTVYVAIARFIPCQGNV